MSKFKIVNRIIDGKNVEVEIGNNTLQYVLINRLTGMRFFGTKKHKLKIKNSIRKANIKNLKHKGLSKEEIEKFLDAGGFEFIFIAEPYIHRIKKEYGVTLHSGKFRTSEIVDKIYTEQTMER